MSRKFLSLALSIALLLTLLGSIPAMAEEPVTVTWYGVGASSDHQARINEAASKYIQSRGVNANLEIIKLGWGDYLQTYQIMLAAHEEFDLFKGQIGRRVLGEELGQGDAKGLTEGSQCR